MMTLRRRKPPDRNYEHIVFTEKGYWNFPDIVKCEGVEPGRWTNIIVARCATYDGLKLAVALTDQAAEELLTRPRTPERFENLIRARRLDAATAGRILECPLFHKFVAYRRCDAEFSVLEFLAEDPDRHLIVAFSSQAFMEFTIYLRNYLHPRTKA